MLLLFMVLFYFSVFAFISNKQYIEVTLTSHLVSHVEQKMQKKNIHKHSRKYQIESKRWERERGHIDVRRRKNKTECEPTANNQPTTVRYDKGNIVNETIDPHIILFANFYIFSLKFLSLLLLLCELLALLYELLALLLLKNYIFVQYQRAIIICSMCHNRRIFLYTHIVKINDNNAQMLAFNSRMERKKIIIIM